MNVEHVDLDGFAFARHDYWGNVTNERTRCGSK